MPVSWRREQFLPVFLELPVYLLRVVYLLRGVLAVWRPEQLPSQAELDLPLHWQVGLSWERFRSREQQERGLLLLLRLRLASAMRRLREYLALPPRLSQHQGYPQFRGRAHHWRGPVRLALPECLVSERPARVANTT